MNGTVLQEFLLLSIDLAIGAGIGFLFDCYRVLRRLLRPGWLVTQLADLFFGVCCALLAFRIFFMVTGGEVNLYSFLFIPAGALLYLRLASRFMQRPLLFLMYHLGRLLVLLYRAACFTARLLWLAVVLPLRGLWWVVSTCFRVLIVLLRILWLPEQALLRWLWRELREGWRSFVRWLRHLLYRD
jgi:spore cortex biosynthesis protein YabQ